ncbi:MAG: hypothetical protein NTZ16_11765 [Verrucomicrobia bacterium]|nr:hypothetical protein [Verrucomicrobiota bacterium]
MAYDSVDKMQTALADGVFSYAKDRKKAAGRCLGTFIEIITFYLLKSWGVAPSVGIERGLAEYKNPAITHNVEYSLHPVADIDRLVINDCDLPLTTSKIFRQFGDTHHLHSFEETTRHLLTKEKILRNSCVIGEKEHQLLVGLVSILEGKGQAELHKLKHGGTIQSLELDLVTQYRQPYAMFECKRVGVEDGMKKGPQTIEKAKQGAYVARTVSSMQRIRTHSGAVHGVLPKKDGTLYAKPYDELMAEIIASHDPELLRNFILTVGVVSNHGNWFSSDNMNKELVVLAQSYDWLLFLTDEGLAEFIYDIVLSKKTEVQAAKDAFRRSYSADKTKNSFTKVQMDLSADKVLQDYFRANSKRIESWFNVITPVKQPMTTLRKQIATLSKKNWAEILA